MHCWMGPARVERDQKCRAHSGIRHRMLDGTWYHAYKIKFSLCCINSSNQVKVAHILNSTDIQYTSYAWVLVCICSSLYRIYVLAYTSCVYMRGSIQNICPRVYIVCVYTGVYTEYMSPHHRICIRGGLYRIYVPTYKLCVYTGGVWRYWSRRAEGMWWGENAHASPKNILLYNSYWLLTYIWLPLLGYRSYDSYNIFPVLITHDWYRAGLMCAVRCTPYSPYTIYYTHMSRTYFITFTTRS